MRRFIDALDTRLGTWAGTGFLAGFSILLVAVCGAVIWANLIAPIFHFVVCK